LRGDRPGPAARTSSNCQPPGRRSAGPAGGTGCGERANPPPAVHIRFPVRRCSVRAIGADGDLAGGQPPAPRHRAAPSHPPSGTPSRVVHAAWMEQRPAGLLPPARTLGPAWPLSRRLMLTGHQIVDTPCRTGPFRGHPARAASVLPVSACLMTTSHNAVEKGQEHRRLQRYDQPHPVHQFHPHRPRRTGPAPAPACAAR
jgi:hypothetical protein